MPRVPFDKTVFINCPFDDEYAPLLEAALFCLVFMGFMPRLANERLEAGENRLDKIFELIRSAKYSIHDLSRGKATVADEYFRMNMPFELGLDLGIRRYGPSKFREKKFLIFEFEAYELKRSMSDFAGQDVIAHGNKYESVIKGVRDFFRVEAQVNVDGPARLISEYATFQGWMTEKKIHEGHSESEAMNLPTRERLDEMRTWVKVGKPAEFKP